MQKLLILFIIWFIAVGNTQRYKKIVHTTDPDARCLDGSPPALYVHEGGQADKFLIFLWGGGYCQGETLSKVIQQCYERSKTLLGSSKYWPQELDVQGFISTNVTENKFATWTKFLLAYCDGSLHQGYRQQTIKYKNQSLYFRGSKIIKAQLAYIEKNYQISQASNIIWTGSSAGAVGTYLWSSYVKQLFQNISNLYFIVDSGIFLDFPAHGTQNHHFGNQLATLYKLANFGESTPLKLCNQANIGNQWKCLLLQYNHQYIKGNFLFINSQYDSWAIPNILKIPCLTTSSSGTGQTLIKCNNKQIQAIEQYRDAYRLLQYEMMLVIEKSSFWSIACSSHVYACFRAIYQSILQRVPGVTGATVRNIVEKFVIDGEKGIINVDHQPWPHNQPCAL